MSCEICGGGNCAKSFHSAESQREFDDKFNEVKTRMRDVIVARLKRLKSEDVEDKEYIPLKEAIDIVEDY